MARNQISTGRCVGMLRAADLVRWISEDAQGLDHTPFPPCPYQVHGKLLNGDEAVICTYAIGGCPSQEVRPTIAGGHTAVCLRPLGTPNPWPKPENERPVSAVRRYMTTEIVTADPDTPLTSLAQRMSDSPTHSIIAVDDEHRPIGLVTAVDLLDAFIDADGK